MVAGDQPYTTQPALNQGIALTGRLAKPQHNPFEPAKMMTESEEMKARLKEITSFPYRTAYCWLKAFADKAMKITTPLVPQPYELAGCSQGAFEEFMRAERIGQELTKDEIKRTVLKRQQELRRLVRPAARQETPDINQKVRQPDKGTLVKALEETYAKKRGKK